MIPGQFDYVRPIDLGEALKILTDREGEAKVLSGGYSLIPLLKLRLAQPALLVDIGHVAGLDGIVETDDECASAHGRPTARSMKATSSPAIRCSTMPAVASATHRSATGERSAGPSLTPIQRPTGRRSSRRPRP